MKYENFYREREFDSRVSCLKRFMPTGGATVTLPDRVRQLLGPTHAAIEQTPFARALIAGTIDRAAYSRAVAQLAHLHSAVEDALAARHEFAPLYRPADMARTDAIACDLVALGHFPDDPTELTAAQCNQIAQWATATPWKLIGALYVLEGSRMGSMALVRPLSKALNVEVRPGVGLDYHLTGMATRPQCWQQFRAQLAALPLTDDQQADVCNGATATMDALHALYASFAVHAETATV
jgi:heme oxygenase